jgi:hypothetical protein
MVRDMCVNSEASIMTSSISRFVEPSSDVLRVRVYACICAFTPIMYAQYSLYCQKHVVSKNLGHTYYKEVKMVLIVPIY